MRVIINLHSKNLIEIAGWRAKAVQINNKKEASLKEVLDAVYIKDKKSLSDNIFTGENTCLVNSFILYVNGVLMPDIPEPETKIKDNVQIHVMDRHFKDC